MRAKLKVRPAEGDPFEIEVGNTATIGRSPDNTVALSRSPHVSRQHAIIRCHNAFEYQLMDLGSRNGTFVDSRRVITPVILRHGSTIRIANNEMFFEQIEEADGSAHADVTIAAAGTDMGAQESATVAIMVCDIRGFSTMSESLPEDSLARILGEWFRDAGNMIQNSGGTIDKFIGDAILAYWNPRDTNAEEASRALATGFSLLQKSATLSWPGFAKPFEIAVALHHGPVTCGNIGLVAQRDATIIGDSVNTAFRMESVMKQLNQRIVFSSDFLKALPHPLPDATDLGEHQLKGKNQAIKLFAPRTP